MFDLDDFSFSKIYAMVWPMRQGCLCIDLASDMDKLVSDAVRRGDYSSPSEIVDEALRMWSEKRGNFGYTLAELQGLVNAGIESGPGKYGSIEETKAEAHRRLSTRQASE